MAELVARRAGRAVVLVYPLVLLVFLWWLATKYWMTNPFTLPSPAATWEAARTMLDEGVLQDATRVTLWRVAVAYLAAISVGVPMGILIGRVPALSRALRPVVAFFFTAPKSAFYPVMMIVLGLGTSSKIAFGFSLALFQVVIATYAAAAAVEDRFLWSARSLGTSRVGLFSRVVLPATAPGAVAGARVALISAIVGVYLGEMIAGSDGLGQLMMRARNSLDTPDIYVCIVTICLIAVALDGLMLFASRRAFHWAEQR